MFWGSKYVCEFLAREVFCSTVPCLCPFNSLQLFDSEALCPGGGNARLVTGVGESLVIKSPHLREVLNPQMNLLLTSSVFLAESWLPSSEEALRGCRGGRQLLPAAEEEVGTRSDPAEGLASRAVTARVL